jgi:hypothetical protein
MGWLKKKFQQAKKAVTQAVTAVANTVVNTVKAVINDPLPVIAQIAGAAVGIPPAVTAAAVTAIRGGSIEDIAKSAVVAGVAQGVAQNIPGAAAAGKSVTSTLADTVGQTTAQAIGQATTSAIAQGAVGGTKAALTGQDIGQGIATGAISGAIASGTGSIFTQVQDNPNWGLSPETTKIVAGATSAGVTAEALGQDPNKAIAGFLVNTGVGALKDEAKALNSKGTPTNNAGMTPQQIESYVKSAPEPSVEVAKSPVELSTEQQNFLINSIAGGNNDVVSEVLNRLSDTPSIPVAAAPATPSDLSPITPGDSASLPPVANVDLMGLDVIPASANPPTPATTDEVNALIGSGLVEDTGLNYGYEQAPNYIIPPSAEKETPQAAPPPTKDEISVPVDSGLTKDLGLNYGYEQAPELSPIVEGDVSPLPPVANVDLTKENIVPESVERTPTTQNEVDALINSGLVEDAGTNYGYEQAAPEKVAAPVDVGSTKDAGLDYGYEQAPDFIPATSEKLPETVAPPTKDEVDALVDSGLIADAGLDYGYEQAPELSPLTEGDASPFPPVTNVDLAAENIAPEGVDRTPTTQDEVDALIDSGLVETLPPPIESIEPTAPDSGESLSEVVVTPPPEDDLEPLIDSGLVEDDGSNYGYEQAPDSGPTTEDDGSNYGYEQAPDYKPPADNVVPSKPVITVPPSKPGITVPSRPTPRQSANTLDDLMSMMQGAPITSTEQEELIKLVKASPYFSISNPLDIGFFDMPTNQDPVKMAEGGYMDILFPKTQLTMDEILQILEGKYHG